MILCILILGLGLASLLINKRPLHILTAVLLPLPALVSFLLLVFSTSYRAQILWGLGVFLILLWYPAVFLRKHGKVVLRIACLATALCLLSSGTLYGMERYRESITLREAQDLLDRYAPYGEDSLVAQLDAPPTLRLEEPLPRMDGATALYPIYSAFARALYPEEQTKAISCAPPPPAPGMPSSGEMRTSSLPPPPAGNNCRKQKTGVSPSILPPSGKKPSFSS
jgi:hypothetical protein